MGHGELEGAHRELMLALAQLRTSLGALAVELRAQAGYVDAAVQAREQATVMRCRADIEARRYRDALSRVSAVLGAAARPAEVRRAALAAWMIADEALACDPDAEVEHGLPEVGTGVSAGVEPAGVVDAGGAVEDAAADPAG